MKKQSFFKVLALIVALLMIVTCVSGCTNGNNNNDTGSESGGNINGDGGNGQENGDTPPSGGNTDTSDPSGDGDNNEEEIKDNSPFEFELNGDKNSYTLVGVGSCMDSEVVIPATYNGKAVNAIAPYAFSNCSAITKVTIPESIEFIGESSFEYCPLLKEVVVPEGVKYIGSCAFGNLTKISLPNSIVSVAGFTFLRDYTMTYNEYENGLYVGNDSNPYLVYIGSPISESNTSITVHPDTRFISDYAFQGNAYLESVTLGSKIEYIGERAFDTCKKLKTIILPDSVTFIGKEAFGWCFELENINIPSGIKQIGTNAFTSCNALKYNELDGARYLGNESDPRLVLIEILDKSVTSFDIHSSTRVIYSSAFKEATSLASVNIPDGVVSIGDNAFYNCSALSDIVLPDGLIAIGELAFARCSSLKSIEIPGSASSFGNSIFERCTSLSSVKLNEGLRVIPYGMLQKCAALETVNIPNSVIEIGAYAFFGCGALESVSLGNSVEVIGEAAFRECGIDKISIPDTLVDIRSDVFKYTGVEYTEYDNALYLGNENNPYLILAKAKSEDITSCTVHPKTRFIYHGAFNECKALVDLQIGESVEVIYQQAFYGCSALKEINLPDSVRAVDYESFAWCSAVESITIGAGVRNISFFSFLSTPALSSISVSEANPAYKSSGNCLIKIHSKTLVKGCNTSVVPSDGSVTVIGAYAFYDADELKEINIPLSVVEIQSTAFGYANIFDTINYEGAKKDWYKIKRAADWDFSRTSYVIHATDGDITVNKH